MVVHGKRSPLHTYPSYEKQIDQNGDMVTVAGIQRDVGIVPQNTIHLGPSTF
jgi:beta-galactosidase/beta-glucuronidase